MIREKSSRTTVVGVIVICLLGARQVDRGFNQQVHGDLCHLANYHHIYARVLVIAISAAWCIANSVR